MKKTLLSTTFLIAGTVGLLAQGIVNFNNEPYNFSDSIELGGTVDYKIYSAPGVLAANTAWRAYIFQAGAQVGAGLPFDAANPGVVNLANDAEAGNRTLTSALGAATTLEVRVFDADVTGGGKLIGKSDPFAYTSPASVTAPSDQFFMVNFRGFVVPEPSTVALGVLGLGALLLFRRRK